MNYCHCVLTAGVGWTQTGSGRDGGVAAGLAEWLPCRPVSHQLGLFSHLNTAYTVLSTKQLYIT